MYHFGTQNLHYGFPYEFCVLALSSLLSWIRSGSARYRTESVYLDCSGESLERIVPEKSVKVSCGRLTWALDLQLMVCCVEATECVAVRSVCFWKRQRKSLVMLVFSYSAVYLFCEFQASVSVYSGGGFVRI